MATVEALCSEIKSGTGESPISSLKCDDEGIIQRKRVIAYHRDSFASSRDKSEQINS